MVLENSPLSLNFGALRLNSIHSSSETVCQIYEDKKSYLLSNDDNDQVNFYFCALQWLGVSATVNDEDILHRMMHALNAISSRLLITRHQSLSYSITLVRFVLELSMQNKIAHGNDDQNLIVNLKIKHAMIHFL